MRLSISITNFSWPNGPSGLATRLSEVVRAADDAGIDTVWVSDHLLQADPTAGVEDTEMLEAYTTLGFLAARTERVRLGTMVTGVTYRPPALLVKAVTTLDVLSGGRAWLGIGAGYHSAESEAMGLPLPPVAERFERLDETLRLALQMWAGDDTEFHGTHYQLQRPTNSPNSVRRPHPPILIGGMGERRTLPLVARYADACNLFDIPDGGKTIRHKLGVLAEHCAAVGRPYEDIDKTVGMRLEPGEPADAFARRCSDLAGLGIDHAAVIMSAAFSDDALATLGDAVPLLEDTGVDSGRQAARP